MAVTIPWDAALSRGGQIKGDAATWGPGAAGFDKDRALFLKLGAAEVLNAFERATIFKGKVRERNIRGGKSVAFPITGKMGARYHEPGKAILGEGNAPSDLNERLISLDGLMIADVAIDNLDELMTYFDVRSIYTTELGRALAVEYDKRVARMIFAAAGYATEPLAKDGTASPKGPADNTGRIGATITLGADYTGAGATRQAKGDALVNAIFDARIKMEKKDVPMDGTVAVFGPDDYYAITMSSRAINTDFNAEGNNGTIAEGRTLRVAGIPILMSNHVTQPAYSLVAGDYNSDYAQDLSKCHGLIFNRECMGVLSLLSPGLQVTSGDWNISHQATLLVARQALGMGVLRAESAVRIITA
jgi:hypothetical protein